MRGESTSGIEISREVPPPVPTPVVFAYASHFLLVHRVTDRTIPILQEAFPGRFSAAGDGAALDSGLPGSGDLLGRFVQAGYLVPAGAHPEGAPRAWVVPQHLVAPLQTELLRYGSGLDGGSVPTGFTGADLALRDSRRRLARVIERIADDTTENEPLLAELAVQLRHTGEWESLEELWFRHGMRMIVTEPEATVDAFGAIPPTVRAAHRGLQLAHVYVEPTAMMQRVRALPQNEEINRVVERLSLQITETAAQIGPSWQDLASPDARTHVGVNWMRSQRLRGDFDGALRTLDELHRRRGAGGAQENELARVSERNLAFLRLEQGILYFFLDRFAEALNALREARLLWHRPANGDYVPAFAEMLTGLIYAQQGDRRRTSAHLAAALTILGEVGGYRYMAIIARTIEAHLALDVLDTDRARGLLESVDDALDSEWWPVVVRVRQIVDIVDGRYADAARVLERVRQQAIGAGRLGPLAHRLLERSRIDGLLAQGQIQRVRAVLDRVANPQPAWMRLARIRIAGMARRPDEAKAQLETLRHRPDARERDLACGFFAAAIAFSDQGAPPVADEDARAAESEGLVRAGLDELVHAPSLLPAALLGARHGGSILERACGDASWEQVLGELGLSDGEARRRIASVAGGFPERALLVDLTAHEHKLLVLLMRDMRQSDIADRFHLALSTVKKQIGALYRKLEVERRDEAVQRGYELGLFDALDPDAA